MAEMQVPVTKGKGTVTIDTDKIPDEIYQYALFLGLKAICNRGMTKVTGSEAEKKEGAMEVAQKNVNDIYAGKTRKVGMVTKAKTAGAVKTEAMRIAKALVKDEMKRLGIKVSHVEASEITRCAGEVLESEQGADIIAQAEANLKARAEAKIKVPLNITVSDKLVKKAAEEAAKKKETLSKTQAGKPAPRAKAKGGQPQATAH